MAQAITEVAGETVKLQKHITAVMSTPRIVEARVSQSGKTIIVERHNSPDMRLDAEKIMSGDCEFRDSYCLQLYSPETFRRTQEMNHSPVPGAGCNRISELGELPDPSHEPMDLSTDSANGGT